MACHEQPRRPGFLKEPLESVGTWFPGPFLGPGNLSTVTLDRSASEFWKETGAAGRPCSVTVYPVSYTHLDVYKRQGSVSSPSTSTLLAAMTCGRPAISSL